jgi:hypothetical protein
MMGVRLEGGRFVPSRSIPSRSAALCMIRSRTRASPGEISSGPASNSKTRFVPSEWATLTSGSADDASAAFVAQIW